MRLPEWSQHTFPLWPRRLEDVAASWGAAPPAQDGGAGTGGAQTEALAARSIEFRRVLNGGTHRAMSSRSSSASAPSAATPPRVDPDALDLLSALLAYDPAQRASAQDALAHRFLRGVPPWREHRWPLRRRAGHGEPVLAAREGEPRSVADIYHHLLDTELADVAPPDTSSVRVSAALSAVLLRHRRGLRAPRCSSSTACGEMKPHCAVLNTSLCAFPCTRRGEHPHSSP